jgi:uncharacterized protein Veg
MKCNVLVYKEVIWIGHIYLLKHIIEGKVGEKIEVTARRGRRSKKLLTNLRKREYKLTGN